MKNNASLGFIPRHCGHESRSAATVGEQVRLAEQHLFEADIASRRLQTMPPPDVTEQRAGVAARVRAYRERKRLAAP